MTWYKPWYTTLILPTLLYLNYDGVWMNGGLSSQWFNSKFKRSAILHDVDRGPTCCNNQVGNLLETVLNWVTMKMMIISIFRRVLMFQMFSHHVKYKVTANIFSRHMTRHNVFIPHVFQLNIYFPVRIS